MLKTIFGSRTKRQYNRRHKNGRFKKSDVRYVSDMRDDIARKAARKQAIQQWSKDFVYMGIVMLIGFGLARGGGQALSYLKDSTKAFAKTELISAIPDETPRPTASPTSTPKPTATPSPMVMPQTQPSIIPMDVNNYDYKAIDDEIKLVFGSHYDKAMLLLRGNGAVNSCKENSSLNPFAVNKNKDNIGSTDYGVFQINDYWQGFRHMGKAEQFLMDYKINIRVAWRIYQDDGYSFKLWTCGRANGI